MLFACAIANGVATNNAQHKKALPEVLEIRNIEAPLVEPSGDQQADVTRIIAELMQPRTEEAATHAASMKPPIWRFQSAIGESPFRAMP